MRSRWRSGHGKGSLIITQFGLIVTALCRVPVCHSVILETSPFLPLPMIPSWRFLRYVCSKMLFVKCSVFAVYIVQTHIDTFTVCTFICANATLYYIHCYRSGSVHCMISNDVVCPVFPEPQRRGRRWDHRLSSLCC